MNDPILEFKQSIMNLSVAQLHIMREDLKEKVLQMEFNPEAIQKIITIDEILIAKGEKVDE